MNRRQSLEKGILSPPGPFLTPSQSPSIHSPRLQPSPSQSPFQQQDVLIVTNNNQHYINTFNATQEQDRKSGTPNRRLSLNHISPNAGTIVYRPSPTQSPAGTEFNTTLIGSNNISLNKKGGKRTPNAVQQYGIAPNACSPKASKKTSGLNLVGSPLTSPNASPQPVIQQFPVMNANNSSIVFMQQPSSTSQRTSIIQTSNTQQQNNFIATTNSGYLKHNKTPQQILPKPSVSGNNSTSTQGLISTTTKQIVTQSKMAIVQQQQPSVQHFQSPPHHQSPQIITGNESPHSQSLSQGGSILLPTSSQPLLLNQMPVLVQQNTPQGVQLILRPPTASQLATPSLVINRPQMQQSQPQQLLRILNANGAMQLATATAPAFIVSSQANIIQQNLQSIKTPGGNAQIGNLQQGHSASRHPQQLINSHILGQSVAQIQNLQLNGNLTQIQMHNGQIIQQLPAQFSQNLGGFNQIQPIAATITNATFQSPPQNNPQNDIVVSSTTTSNPIQYSQQIISPVATPQPQIIQSTDQILSPPPSITFNSQPNGTVILGADKQLHDISSPPPFSIQGTSEMINFNMSTHHQQQPTVTTKPARKPKKSKKKLAQEQQQQQSAVAMISPTRNNSQASAGKIDLANVMKICGIMDDDFMDTDDQGMEQSFENETIHIPNSTGTASNNESNEITITIPSTTSDQPFTFTIPSSSLDSSNIAGTTIIQSDGEKMNENVPFMIRIDSDGQGSSNQPFTISVPSLTSNLTTSEDDLVTKNDENGVINCVPTFVNSVLNSSVTPTIQSQINEIQNQLMSLPSTINNSVTTQKGGGKAPRQKKQTTKKSKKQQQQVQAICNSTIEVPTQIGNIQISQIDGTNLKSSMIESKNINNQIQIMPILEKGPIIEKQKMQVPVMQQTISHNQSDNSDSNSNQQHQQGSHTTGPSQVNINVQQNQLINVTNNLQMQVIANPQQQHQPTPAPSSASNSHHQTSSSTSSQPAQLTSHAQNIIGNIIGQQNQSSSGTGNIIIQGTSAFNQQQPANIQVNIQNQTIANNIIHAPPAQNQANQAQQSSAHNILSQLTGNLVLSLSEDGRLILRHDPNIPQDAQSQMILQTILTGALGNVSLINEPLKHHQQQQPIIQQNHSQPTATTTHHVNVIGANGKVQQVTTVQNKNVIITTSQPQTVQHAHQIFNNLSTIASQGAQNIVTSAVQQTNQQQKPQAVVLPTPNIIKFVELPKIQPNQQLFSLNTLTNEITLLNSNQTTAALSPMERLLIVPSGINAEQLAQCLSQGQIHFNNIGQAPPMTDPSKIQMQVQHQQLTFKTANVQHQKSIQIKKEPVDAKPPKKARGKKAKLLEEHTANLILSQKEIKKEPVNSPPPTPKKIISAIATTSASQIIRTSLASSIAIAGNKNTITISPNSTMIVNSTAKMVSTKYNNAKTNKNSISVIPTSSLFPNTISSVSTSTTKSVTTVSTTKSAAKNKVITTAAPPPLVSVNQAPVPRVQTIQLTSQKQQSLKNVQMQIQQLSAKLQNKNLLATLTADLDFNNVVFNKPLPVLNNIEAMTDGDIYEALQRLFVEQQKILATGKIIPTLPAATVTPGNQQTIRAISNSQPIFVSNQKIIAPITSTPSSLYGGGNSQKIPSPIQVNSPIVKQENQLCSASSSSQPPPLVVSTPIQMQVKTEILSSSSSMIPTIAPPATGSIIISPKYTTATPVLKITIDPPVKEQKVSPRESKVDIMPKASEVDAAAILKQKQITAAAEALQKKKTIRSSLFKRQICVDQEGCTKPDIKVNFTSKEDAVKRLIRYHCIYEEIKGEENPKENFGLEEKSKHILASFQVMKEKFQHLLIKQSQQHAPTSELMMLDRLQVADLKDEIMTMQMELNSVLFENQQVTLEASTAIKTEIINPPGKNNQNLAVNVGRSLPSMQEPSQILKAKQEQKLFESIKNERIKVENADKDERASSIHNSPQITTQVQPKETSKLNKSTPRQPNMQSQAAVTATTSIKLTNELEDFDIESEIQSNFIMKKCEPVGSPSSVGTSLSQNNVKKPVLGKEREFSPLSDYLDSVKMELLPSKISKGHESIKSEIHESTYDEWLSLQKELNLELNQPKQKETEERTKKMSPKSLEPDLSDIFDDQSSSKSVEKQLDDLFSSASKSNDLLGSTASPSGLNELFNVESVSDKTVENRLEALFGQDDVKSMQQDVESRLEQLFQGSVNSNDESALDNASFLYKNPDLTYHEIIQKQVSNGSSSNANNTNKRQWNSGNSCDIFSSTGSTNIFPPSSPPSISSSKRACTASSVTFDDNKWIDESFDFGNDINMQTESSNDGLTKHREWSRNISQQNDSIMTNQQFPENLHANIQANSSQSTINLHQRHTQSNAHLIDTTQTSALNYEEDADDISRQVQNAIDSILNLQSSDPLHYQLDSSFLELNSITSSSPSSPMIQSNQYPSIQHTTQPQTHQFSAQNTKVTASSNIAKQKKYSRIEDIGDCLIGGGNLDDSPSALSLGLSDSHEGSSASVGEFVNNLLNCDEKSISTS